MSVSLRKSSFLIYRIPLYSIFVHLGTRFDFIDVNYEPILVSEWKLLAVASLLRGHSRYPNSCEFIKLSHIAVFDTTHCP